MVHIFYSIDSLDKILKDIKPSKVCIVTSKPLQHKLAWAIKKINIPKSHIIILADGEKAKEWGQLEKLLQRFNVLNLDRNSLIIALGGGTVGDITGFASSIYLRGLKYIHIPTTLLAQVDSSHGGKTGINFLGLKNQIGSFYLPIKTIIDSRFTISLPKEQIINGLGEIIKAGFIHDKSILSILKKHTVSSLIQSPDLLRIIKKSISVKNYFTENDFKDTGLRQILNVGHTVGHAIELKYGINHGRSVIVGMIKELIIAEKLNLTQPTVRENLEHILDKLGIIINTNLSIDWDTILHDKKITGQTIDFPVIETVGKAKIIKLDLKKLKKELQ